MPRLATRDVSLQEVAQRARMIGRQQFRGNVPDSLMPFLMQRAADSMITQGAWCTKPTAWASASAMTKFAAICTRDSSAQVLLPRRQLHRRAGLRAVRSEPVRPERAAVRAGGQGADRLAEAAGRRRRSGDRERQGDHGASREAGHQGQVRLRRAHPRRHQEAIQARPMPS